MLSVKLRIGPDVFTVAGDIRLHDPHLLYLLRVWLSLRAAAAPAEHQGKLDALAAQLDAQATNLKEAVEAASIPPAAPLHTTGE